MRIIAGQFKGRRLLSPQGRQTRPITDRVKVSLFGILTPDLPQAAVADLFCGTGSFGLEALSRGARHCWFADLDRNAVSLLRQNIQALGIAGQSTVWLGDIPRKLPGWLAELPGPLDVVSLDPPYAMARQWFAQDDPAGRRQGAAVLAALAPALAADGVIVVRTPRDLELADLPAALLPARRREYGSMALNFLRHAGDDAD